MGIFPRIAHEVFQRKTKDWTVTVRYFQNIVNSVRDLTSITAQEKSFRHGLHKDRDGFMEFNWVEVGQLMVLVEMERGEVGQLRLITAMERVIVRYIFFI